MSTCGTERLVSFRLFGAISAVHEEFEMQLYRGLGQHACPCERKLSRIHRCCRYSFTMVRCTFSCPANRVLNRATKWCDGLLVESGADGRREGRLGKQTLIDVQDTSIGRLSRCRHPAKPPKEVEACPTETYSLKHLQVVLQGDPETAWLSGPTFPWSVPMTGHASRSSPARPHPAK